MAEIGMGDAVVNVESDVVWRVRSVNRQDLVIGPEISKASYQLAGPGGENQMVTDLDIRSGLWRLLDVHDKRCDEAPRFDQPRRTRGAVVRR